MRKHFGKLAVSLLMLAAMSHPVHADNLTAPGLQQPFNWQAVWGKINFTPNGTDPGIPSTQMPPKSDIKSVITDNGTQNNDLSSLHAYTFDINGDGKNDYIIDGHGYFPQYQNPNGPVTICTAEDGCYVSIYIAGQDTNLITASNDTPAPPATSLLTPGTPQDGATTTAGSQSHSNNAPSCPSNPADNTTCISGCAATEQNCPSSFQYNMHTAFDEQVLAWNFMTASAFQTWSAGTSYQVANTNHIFVALRNNNKCYNDELSLNNNQCVKYYQYVGDATTGAFVDLYNFQDTTTGEYNTRYTANSFDRVHSSGARGTIIGAGTGYKLVPGGTLDIQFDHFTLTDIAGAVVALETSPFGFPAMEGVPAVPNFASFHIENHSGNNYFIPTKTDAEFSAFVNSAQPGVTISPEELQFTAWVGDTQCPDTVTAPETVAATRFCQSSTSAYRPCQECIDAKVPGYEQGCTMVHQCTVNTCVFDDSAWVAMGNGWWNPIYAYNGTMTTLLQCQTAEGIWSTINAHDGNVATYGCDAVFADLCNHGHFCLAGETMITMADGTTKRIDEIKAGDTVMGFKKPQGALKAHKVKTVAITPKEKLLSINGGELQLTPNHHVVTGKGYKMMASLLKVGDTLLRGDKTTLTVKSIDTVPATSTVYNLILEDNGTGFIANNIRVTDYKH